MSHPDIASTVQPYLYFQGRCEEALEFYKQAIGAEVPVRMRFSDNPEPNQMQPQPPADKIMHAEMKIGNSVVMVSDGCCNVETKFQGFALTLNAATLADADQYFNALSNGGAVQLPPTRTFFSPKFSMLTDKFGVAWVILAAMGAA